MRFLIACTLAIVSLFPLFHPALAFDGPTIIYKSSFVDSEGRTNIVGTVRNFFDAPVQVAIGIETDDGIMFETQTYARVIWPLTDAPFKFILESDTKAGDPFIIDVKEVKVTNYNSMLELNYDSMAVGEEKAFVGTIKNNGPFDVYNISVFAGVHSADHKEQIETVRSNIIEVIKSGEQANFTAVPDLAIREGVFYYSCAGLDYDDPITTIRTTDGRLISYSIQSAAQLSRLRYEDSTDSIAFSIRPYAPSGGQFSIMLPQFNQNPTLLVLLDGQAQEASIKRDGKTLSIDFFVPKGDHDVQIQGVRNVPELPIAAIVLAALLGGLVVISRSKSAFKIF